MKPSKSTQRSILDDSVKTDTLPSRRPSSSHDLSQIDDDERLALQLTEEENQSNRDCSSDAVLAGLLQRQFDLDYNKQLDKEEARRNGLAKVGVSLDKFKRATNPDHICDLEALDDTCSSDEMDYNHLDDDLPLDVFEQCKIKEKSRMVGRAGFVLDRDGNMITKHDIPTSSRKNMCRLMESKTDIKTGDGGAQKDDFMLTNYVYNKLQVHSKKSSRRANQREFDKKERENSIILTNDLQSIKLNSATKLIVDGLIANSCIEQLNGVIGHGKESTIFHAIGRNIDDIPHNDIAIKIFKPDLHVAFKTRDSYNKSKCPSFKFDKPKSKNDSLNKWAERGYKNLKSMRKADINCPEPILLRKHVLIMSYLGNDLIPSPTLKEANLNPNQLRQSYDQVIDIMERMYRDCDLIHGDLSEYNLLWHNDRVYVIDVSQSMSSSHPSANRFLHRDCRNILSFYEKSNLMDITDTNSLFSKITGKSLDENDLEFWCKIEDFPCNERMMARRSNNIDQKVDLPDQILHPTNSIHEVLVEE